MFKENSRKKHLFVQVAKDFLAAIKIQSEDKDDLLSWKFQQSGNNRQLFPPAKAIIP